MNCYNVISKSWIPDWSLMGRTYRKRCKRIRLEKLENLDHELQIIDLQKWLKRNDWENTTRLRLRNFSQTGRGVTSNKTFEENDVVITIPYDLMITYNIVETNLKTIVTPIIKLKIHDLLALFLITERNKENSPWKDYINSLPSESPPLPWLATSEELNLFPADLQIISRKNRGNFEESLSRIRRSISERSNRVMYENEYKWGFVLVNTRAVYVDPQLAGVRNPDFLLDEPSMALCPFLDMFNHHFLANSETELVCEDDKLVYRLITLTTFKKYEQIFISYGPHDNVKLLMEYGFFIPGNIYDVIKFNFKELLKNLKLSLNERQYKFIKEHNFDNSDDLYVEFCGISFHLKAVLFVAFAEGLNNLSSVIFSDCYPQEFLESIPVWTRTLLDFKLETFKSDYEKLRDCNFEKSSHAILLESFLKYRIDFVEKLRNTFFVS